MAEFSKLRISELDFDQIKSNLKTYLKNQDTFKDYNFEGSGLAVLLDILAYNTHYNNYYANMLANEMFLDSAVKRNSVVSLAKQLGYIPNSAKASTAVVNITLSGVPGNPAFVTLPKGARLKTSVGGVGYSFNVMEDVSVARNASNQYVFSNITIKEGTYISMNYTVNNITATYTIPDENIDVSTLKIRVKTSSSSVDATTYTKASDIFEVKPTSTVYFLEEIDKGLFEIAFGDNVLGKQLSVGNIITAEYLVTNRDEPNSATSFTLAAPIAGTSSAVITLVSSAAEGSGKETVDSIKFNAPKYYSAQNRAVTAEDYKVLIPKLYTNVDSVQVWGGEDNDPPAYGKVVISIKPKSGYFLTTSTKEFIKSTVLKSRNMVSIVPEFVDPEYIYVQLNVSFYYNPNLTNLSESALKANVTTAIRNYNISDLNKFDSVFRHSKLSRIIDNVDPAVLNNTSTMRMKKEITVDFGTPTKYDIKYYNPIFTQGSDTVANISSTGFKIAERTEILYLDDDGAGKIRSYYIQPGTNTKIIVNPTLGTVDYVQGVIALTQLTITDTEDGTSYFSVFATPNSDNLVSVRNQIFLIEDSSEGIVVNAIVDKVATGEASAGTDYTIVSNSNLSSVGTVVRTSN